MTYPKFVDKNGDWLPPELWPSYEVTAVCGTETCPVKGIGFEVTLYENVDGVERIQCGRCGQRPTVQRR